MTAFGGALTDPTKIMGSRIGAYAVDSIVAAVVVLGAFFVFDAGNFDKIDAPSSAAAQAFCDEVNAVPPSPGQVRNACIPVGSGYYWLTQSQYESAVLHVQLGFVGFGLLNYVALSAIAGGTVGKLLFGLRVTTARGQRAGFGRNLVRWLLLIVDAACCWIPGLLTSMNSKGHRRIGDMVAGTYVVHRSAEGRLLNIPGHLVVRNRQDPYVQAATPPGIGTAPHTSGAPTTITTADGIAAPVFDPSRNTYVRYDQSSGVWFQWDDRTQSWIPAQQ